MSEGCILGFNHQLNQKLDLVIRKMPNIGSDNQPAQSVAQSLAVCGRLKVVFILIRDNSVTLGALISHQMFFMRRNKQRNSSNISYTLLVTSSRYFLVTLISKSFHLKKLSGGCYYCFQSPKCLSRAKRLPHHVSH